MWIGATERETEGLYSSIGVAEAPGQSSGETHNKEVKLTEIKLSAANIPITIDINEFSPKFYLPKTPWNSDASFELKYLKKERRLHKQVLEL